jgi:hypothetical protein
VVAVKSAITALLLYWMLFAPGPSMEMWPWPPSSISSWAVRGVMVEAMPSKAKTLIVVALWIIGIGVSAAKKAKFTFQNGGKSQEATKCVP